ncbi:MAG TPA: energy transducer TonB [Puia sp.]|nr:energy transducer TonB [Puia sp.]
MKRFLPLVFICFSSYAFSQKIEKYYDFAWHECDPGIAVFYGLVEKTDSGWYRTDYFIREKHLQMSGTYEDADCKKPNGRFYYFHANGVCLLTGDYVHGKKNGLWLSFHPNKMMADSTYYVNGSPRGISLGWYENGNEKDSSNWNADGSGVSIAWFPNGQPQSAGRYAPGGKPDGKWQFFHSNGQLSALETYQQGKLTDRKYYNEQGHEMSDTTDRRRDAEFPGGLKAWQKYISKGLYFPDQYKLVNGDRAIVVVTFTIDENGSVTEVYTSTPFYPAFDRIAENVIRRSPKWIPAMDHNRTVRVVKSQPVYFAEQ